MNHAVQHTACCASRAASITVAGAPKIHAICHCRDCKRRTGSAFGYSVYFPRTEVVARGGDTRVHALRHPLRGDAQERHFCASCGTTLFWYDEAMPALIGVAAGCFADGEFGEPRLSASHARKLGWVQVPAVSKQILD